MKIFNKIVMCLLCFLPLAFGFGAFTCLLNESFWIGFLTVYVIIISGVPILFGLPLIFQCEDES